MKKKDKKPIKPLDLKKLGVEKVQKLKVHSSANSNIGCAVSRIL